MKKTKSGINIRLIGLTLAEANQIICSLGKALQQQFSDFNWNLTYEEDVHVHIPMIKDPPGLVRVWLVGGETDPAVQRGYFDIISGFVKDHFKEWVEAGFRTALVVESLQLKTQENLSVGTACA